MLGKFCLRLNIFILQEVIKRRRRFRRTARVDFILRIDISYSINGSNGIFQNILYKFTVLLNRVLLSHYTYRHTCHDTPNFLSLSKNFYFYFPQVDNHTPSHAPTLRGGNFASTSEVRTSVIFPLSFTESKAATFKTSPEA